MVIMRENDKYIQSLVGELGELGIKPSVKMDTDTSSQASEAEKKLLSDMEALTKVKYSDEQKKVLLHHGSMCILSTAGSGKTTISTHLIVKRLLTREITDPKKLIYTTYSKAGTSEMKERLDQLLDTVGLSSYKKLIEVRTLHSFFYSLIRTFGLGMRVVEAYERSNYIRKACTDSGVHLGDDDLQVIDNLLSYQVNNLLSDSDAINSSANTLDRGNLTVERYTNVRKLYAMQKYQNKCIDFDDMQTYLYAWLITFKNSENESQRETYENIISYCKSCYSDFFIDEAQDVSKIQFEILRAIIEDRSKEGKLEKGLVFIGDNDQCLYSWRGSDPKIILNISPEFNIPTFILGTNYRCKSNIVDFAAKGIWHNVSGYDKDMRAENSGGKVDIIASKATDLCSLSVAAYSQIKSWLKSGEKNKDIAVLARNNFHLALLGNMLARDGIYCNCTDEMKLTKNIMYKDVKGLIELARGNTDKTLTAKLLWKLCTRLRAATAKVLSEAQGSVGVTFAELMEAVASAVEYEEISIKLPASAKEQIQRSLWGMGSVTKEDIKLVAAIMKSDSLEKRIKGLLYQYLNVTTGFIYSSADKQRSVEGLVKYINNLMIKDGVEPMLEFLRTTEQFETGKYQLPKDTSITLSTVHSAKGKEWKNVILFAMDNVSIPSADSITKMVYDGVSVSDIYDYIDEERRIFYVGCTRAKDNLAIITYDVPSFFVLENLGIFDSLRETNGKTLELAQMPEKYTGYIEEVQKSIEELKSKMT